MSEDILERVSRSNPVVLAQVRPLDELIETIRAAGNPAGSTRARNRHPTKRTTASIVALAAGSLLTAFLVLAPGRETDVLAAMYTAITPQTDAVHIVTTTTRRVDGTLDSITRQDVWAQPHRHRARTASTTTFPGARRAVERQFATDGAVVRWWSDSKPGVIREIPLNPDTSISVPDGEVSLLRWLYRAGRLHLAGKHSVRGERVWKLSGDVTTTTRLTAVIDARTFVPTEIKQIARNARTGRETVITTRYEVFRRVSASVGLTLAGHEGLPVVRIHSGGPVVRSRLTG